MEVYVATCIFFVVYNDMLNKNTLGINKCEVNQKQHCKQVSRTLISAEAKKLHTYCMQENFGGEKVW